jgi:hypothetical protein
MKHGFFNAKKPNRWHIKALKKSGDSVKPKPRRHHFLSEFYLNVNATSLVLMKLLFGAQSKEARLIQLIPERG